MNILLKDPDAILDYAWDWTAWLQNGETITAQTVTAPDGITIETSPPVSQSGGVVTAWVSGGTIGQRYDLVCHVTTSAGRQDDRTLTLNIQQR